MLKKSVVSLILGVAISSTSFFVGANAASVVKNGVACAKSGATTVVTFKGVKSTYLCTTNPAAASNPNIAKSGKTWTLKTCVTYYAAAQSQQDIINQQLPLIALMSEPDKSTYGTQLKASQAKLMRVFATIENNYCKTGL
jgi:hypothetical protein